MPWVVSNSLLAYVMKLKVKLKNSGGDNVEINGKFIGSVGKLTKSKVVGGTGFRDLVLFNDSLLAKQAWRLMQNKEILYYKIFKARFFPHCPFMEVKDLALGSYAWKSILKGREVIQRGPCWRVGDGKSIKIWQHY